MMAKLTILPQGGLGNQLIQYGYAQSLASRTGAVIEVNPILMSAAWARLRRVSFRPLSSWLSGYWPELQGRRRYGFDLLQSKVSKLKGRLLNDSYVDEQLINILATAPSQHRYWMLGYYQRCQAFSPEALPLWRQVSNMLLATHNLTPHPQGRIAMHVRLGDYLQRKNQKLFASLSLKSQVMRALSWRDQLGSQGPIALFSDSPTLLTAQLHQICTAQQRLQLKIHANINAESDFIAMVRHRHIVASNSTFSLCAGKLSQLLWETPQGQSLLLPESWYKNTAQNKVQMQELENCSFTVKDTNFKH
jgi:hypothetical protein